MAIQNRLTQILGIEHPVLLAPMGPSLEAGSRRQSVRPVALVCSAVVTATALELSAPSPSYRLTKSRRA